MAAKKKSSRRVPSPPSSTAEGRFSILLEQVLDQNRGTIEAVQSLEQKMEKRFAESDERSELRFSSLEAAVRINSEGIKKNSEDIQELITTTDGLKAAVRINSEDIRKNSEDIRKNSEDIRKNSEDIQKLITTADGLTQEIKALGRRVDRIETVLAMNTESSSTSDLDSRVRRIEERLGLVT